MNNVKNNQRETLINLVTELRLNLKFAIKRKFFFREEYHLLQRVKSRSDALITASDADDALVSIIIPFYNKSDTLEDTLRSIDRQTHKALEVILVDDGSRRSEYDKAKKYLKNYNFKSRILSQKNTGVAGARNKGISEANGCFVVCLDPDDTLESNYIEECASLLASRPLISFVTTGMKIFGVRNEEVVFSQYDPWKLYETNMFITASMFRKSSWQDVGGFKDGIGYEDWEFWLSLAESGHIGYSIKSKLFRYRTVETSRFTEQNRKHRAEVLKIRKIHPNYFNNTKSSLKKLLSKN